jgi:hypothetical protein
VNRFKTHIELLESFSILALKRYRMRLAGFMATIEIHSWGEFVGGTAWDAHPETELKKRMRSGVNLSQHELKALARRIRLRQTITVHEVREHAVLGISQILRAMGAEFDVVINNSNSSELFRRWPKRL